MLCYFPHLMWGEFDYSFSQLESPWRELGFGPETNMMSDDLVQRTGLQSRKSKRPSMRSFTSLCKSSSCFCRCASSWECLQVSGGTMLGLHTWISCSSRLWKNSKQTHVHLSVSQCGVLVSKSSRWLSIFEWICRCVSLWRPHRRSASHWWQPEQPRVSLKLWLHYC
jgi:hypothetical protein